jgi:hypothetical protein
MVQKEQINLSLGVALLFTAVTGIFTLFTKLVSFALLHNGVGAYLRINLLWVIVVIVIVAVLTSQLKKLNQKNYFHALKNETITITAGILIVLQGLLALANTLPSYIMSIQTSLQVSHSIANSISNINRNVIAVDIISIVITLLQILYGIYMAKSKKIVISA